MCVCVCHSTAPPWPASQPASRPASLRAESPHRDSLCPIHPFIRPAARPSATPSWSFDPTRRPLPPRKTLQNFGVAVAVAASVRSVEPPGGGEGADERGRGRVCGPGLAWPGLAWLSVEGPMPTADPEPAPAPHLRWPRGSSLSVTVFLLSVWCACTLGMRKDSPSRAWLGAPSVLSALVSPCLTSRRLESRVHVRFAVVEVLSLSDHNPTPTG